MVDEAYAAFGLEQPPRHFAVLCDFDVPAGLTLGDGTVGVNGTTPGDHTHLFKV